MPKSKLLKMCEDAYLRGYEDCRIDMEDVVKTAIYTKHSPTLKDIDQSLADELLPPPNAAVG